MTTMAQERARTAAAAAIARAQAHARAATTAADDTFITPAVARDMRLRVEAVSR